MTNNETDSRGLRNYVVHGISWLFMFRAISLGIGLVINIVLARLLLAQGFGVYTFVITLISLLVVPALFGFVPLIIRETARQHQDRNWAGLASITRIVRSKLILSSILISLGCAAIARFIFIGKMEIYYPVFLVALPLVPVFVFLQVNGAILRGLHHVVASQIPEFVFRRVGFLIVVGCIYLFFENIGTVKSVVFAYVLLSFISLALSAFLVRSNLPNEVSGVPAQSLDLNWITASLPFLLINGITLINQHTDIVMLGILTDSITVGIYQAASRSAGIVIMVLTIVNIVIQPAIVNLYNSGENPKLQKLITHSARLILLSACVCFVALALFGRFILMIFGPEFSEGENALLILAAGHLFHAFAGSAGMVLSMTGHEKEALRGVAVGAFINILLNLILIPMYGIEGAAIATSVSAVIWSSALIWFTFRKTGFHTTAVGVISRK